MSFFLGIALSAFAGAVFILLFLRLKSAPPERRAKRERKAAGVPLVKTGRRGDYNTCPLCAAVFEHGETVRSKIFPPTQKKERLLHITGCPYCLNGERERRCPVCNAELLPDDYLSAYITVGKEKTHVHVKGCTRCLRQRR